MSRSNKEPLPLLWTSQYARLERMVKEQQWLLERLKQADGVRETMGTSSSKANNAVTAALRSLADDFEFAGFSEYAGVAQDLWNAYRTEAVSAKHVRAQLRVLHRRLTGLRELDVCGDLPATFQFRLDQIDDIASLVPA